MREKSSQSMNTTLRKTFIRGGETKVMKKTLSSLLVFALVLTMLVPAFAFAADAKPSAEEMAKSLSHIFQGDHNGNLNLDTPMDRAQLSKVVSLLLDLEVKAPAADAKPSFNDVTTSNATRWAYEQGFIDAAVKAEILVGVGHGQFNPGGEVTYAQIATVLARVLELGSKDSDPWYAEHLAAVQKLGFLVDLDESKVDTAAPRSVLVEAAYIANGVLNPPAPTTLEVVGVSATNLKEVYVSFNTDVDAATVLDANFKLAKGSISVTSTVQLVDSKTAVVTVADPGLTNQGEYTLTVDKVKSVAGSALSKTVKTFVALDNTLAVVKGITVTGPKSFDIEFSEPINTVTGATVEVKSGNSVIGVNGTAFSGRGTNVIGVQLFSSLVDGTTYNVTVKNFVDYAGYNNAITTVELHYVKNTDAPTAKVVKAEQKYVVVEFDKPVTGLTTAHFYHTFTAWTAKEIYSDAAMTTPVTAATAVKKVYVKFADDATDKALPEGTVGFVIKDKVGTVAIKDAWGNLFAGATFDLTITADKSAPAVTSIEVLTEQSLRVTFNKAVNFTKDNVEVLATDGSAIAGVYVTVTQTKANVFTVDFGKNLSGKTVVVNIKNVTDTTLGANKLASYSENVTITDKTAPEVSKVTYKFSANEQAIYVFFSEPVNETAVNEGNYFFYDTATAKNKLNAISYAPVFYQGNSIVRIDVTNDERAAIAGGTYDLFVANIKDLAGNAMLVGQQISFDDSNTDKASVKKVVATDVDTVEITFDQYLTRVDLSAFEVNGVAAAGLSLSTNAAGNTVATLTVDENNLFAYDVAGATVEITAAGVIENVFGVAANLYDSTALGAVAIEDGIAPAVALDVTGKIKDITVTSATTIEIAYTEDLDATAISRLTYSVRGNTVDSVSVTNNVVELTLGTALTGTNPAPEVTQLLDVYDLAGNKLAPKAYGAAPYEQIAPTATGDFTNANAKIVVITFSEAMKASTLVQTNFSSVAGGPITGFTKSSDNKSVTITFTNNLATGDSVAIAAAVEDAQGNSRATATVTKP